MNIEELRQHCLAIKNAEECTPFGEDVLVYKIMNKMFAYYPLNPKDNEHFVVMKCDPEKTVELREKYKGITKGYYAGENLMWNSVSIQKDVPDELIIELIQHSVDEVFKKLPKKKQEEYNFGEMKNETKGTVSGQIERTKV
jgi:predicted DNA-binding protein (MmcQ/YjbR family)